MNKKNKLLRPKTKDEVVMDIVQLLDEYHITIQDLRIAINPSNRTSSLTADIINFISFCGGVLIFAGLIIAVGLAWSTLNTHLRILTTLGTGIIFFMLSMIMYIYNNKKMGNFLFIASLFFQPLGLLVAINEFEMRTDMRILVLSILGVIFIQQIFVFLKAKTSFILFTALSLLTAMLILGLDIFNADDKAIEIIVGLVLLLLTFLIDKTAYRTIAGFWYLMGGILFLAGLFDLLQDRPIESTYLVVSCGVIYLSTLIHSRALLFISTLATVSYIGYFANTHLFQTTPWPFMLALLGLVLFGAGTLAYKLSKNFKQ